MSQPENNDVQIKLPQQPHVVAIFALVGMSITGLMSVIGFFNQSYVLAITLMFASFTYFLGFFLYTKFGKTRLSSAIVIYSLYILMFYLVYTGGVASTGPLWVFIVAPVSVYIHGLKRGVIDIIVFLTIVAIIMHLPATIDSYQNEFKVRFFLSFTTVAFLSALYEFSREKWYNHTLELTHKYQQLALFDPLTQISNRRNAQLALEQEQSRIERGGETACILICDVDHFKHVNDAYGHQVGDEVLVGLANLFKSQIRNQDLVARWGGEEFLFVLPQTSLQNAILTAEKILSKTREHPFVFDNKAVQITISIGVASMAKNIDLDTAINTADKHLYKAKTAGRNQVCA